MLLFEEDAGEAQIKMDYTPLRRRATRSNSLRECSLRHPASAVPLARE